MRAIILAGGLGKRLIEVTKDEIPKPMVLVNGKPFLEHLINYLKKNGLYDIVLSVGYLKEKIIDYFGYGRKFGVAISYSEEDEQLGTGGAIKKAIRHLDKGSFFIINGDTFFEIDYLKMLKFHEEKVGSLVTMAVSFVSNLSRYTPIIFDKNSKIIIIEERGLSYSGYINGGVCLIEKELNYYMKEKCSFEEDVLRTILKNDKEIYVYDKGKRFIDIGTPEDYKKFCEEMNE